MMQSTLLFGVFVGDILIDDKVCIRIIIIASSNNTPYNLMQHKLKISSSKSVNQGHLTLVHVVGS